MTSQGCDKDGNFSFVIHGLADSQAIWAPPLISRLQQHRQGCGIFVNWGYYSDNVLAYPEIVSTYGPNVAQTLLRRLNALENVGVQPIQFFIYGHSIGARIAVVAGIGFGGRIPFIDRKISFC